MSVKNSRIIIAFTMAAAVATVGCQKKEEIFIPFQEGDLYAVAYLGYQEMGDLTPYLDTYLDGRRPDSFFVSDGDIYLVIPRYPDMEMKLWKNRIDMEEPEILYETDSCRPFLIHCNISDIFADAVVEFSHEGKIIEYSPFLSLEDGSIQTGESGVLLP